MSLFLYFFLWLAASKVLHEMETDEEETTVLVPNSCLTHEDASDVVVKLLDDDAYPALKVRCTNQYMIVDLNKDPEWYSYLSSYRKYHYNLIGPEKDDHCNWQEWLVAPMDDFLISPDCQSCDATHELNRKYSTSSAYYMTPVTDGCTQLPIGRIGCDMDWHSYACRVCETAQTREPGYWNSYEVFNGLNDPTTTLHLESEVDEQNFVKYGLCGFTIRDAKALHSDKTDTFKACKTVTHEDVLGEKIMPRRKPSLGQDGRFCMCVKPDTYTEYSIAQEQLLEKQEEIVSAKLKKNDVLDEDDEDDSDSLEVIKLYQSDFEDGTYRITKSGKYVIMEDITFDFKAPEGYENGDLDTYNGAADWWPEYEQIDAYPGAGDLKDSYFLGFWAGIAIECDDVILELNHHTLQMSEAFFYQQSFFALISLTSQIFLPGQGPGFFGADPQSATNVMIRNGNLGLTSHHGIQGNFNKNVLVENVKIYDFKTHGIQFNGFDGVTIKNVDVGPNRKIDRLTPYYAHMKALLPIYRIMVENEQIAQDTCVHFVSHRYPGDECVTMPQLMDDVQTLLDMAFEYVMFDKTEYDDIDVGEFEEDEEMQRRIKLWQDNRDALINFHHSTQTATLYGIFLNYIGSNVIGWYAGSDSTHSKNLNLENVKVHDLHHDTYENIAFSQGEATAAQRILNCLNAPFNAYHIFGEEAVEIISACNNYANFNAETKKCLKFYEDGLEYTGNIITDIQILSFELINNYGLSWNYCSAGAADMDALVEFALRGTQFEDFTPLLVGTHDPMIHPGKGVMGIRLNGVDSVDFKDVKVNNIHSSTGVGSLLGGPYETVVSQQAPYMDGFSMNMVNGLTMTFTTNVILTNVEVHHIISNTGLAYGVAAWYKTQVQIFGKKGLKIHHVHAGVELAPSNEYRSDSYPNLKPEACAFRIYDDVIYNAVIKYDVDSEEENLVIECITGHTGCLMTNDEYTNIGYVGECEDEAADAEVEAISNRAAMMSSPAHGRRATTSPMMMLCGGVALIFIAMLVCIKVANWNKNKSVFKSAQVSALRASAESTPLLK